MSIFSEKLSQLARNKEIKMYQLAEYCGLDRSTVYKYLSGSRPVNSLELVTKFSEALQLDPTQMEELTASYKISRMGDEKYFRRKKVLEFFNTFSPALLNAKTPVPVPTPLIIKNPDLPAECQVYEAEEQVNAVVWTALSAEFGKMNGQLKIIVQPEYQFLFQILDAAMTNGCKIQHILCLENTSSSDAAQYNLDCLKTVTKSLLTQSGYTPFYLYDSVSAHFRNHMLLPYLVVTSTCAIQISYDLQHAVYYTDKNQVDFFQGMFAVALRRSILMVNRLDNISDCLGFYLEQYTKFGQHLSACNAEPCLVPYLDHVLLEKHTRTFEHRAELLNLFNHYIAMQSKIISKNKPTEYFSAEGVDYFCRTGHIWQLPAYAITPLEPVERYELLRKYLNSRTATNTFLLKKSSPLLLGKLEAVTWRDGGVSFVYEHSPDQYTAFFLLEKSLSFYFADFFAYICEGDMAYSNEESMKYIQDKMDALKRELQSTRPS